MKYVNELTQEELEEMLNSIGFALIYDHKDVKTGEYLLPYQNAGSEYIMCRCEFCNISYIAQKYNWAKNIYRKLDNLKISAMIAGLQAMDHVFGMELVFLNDYGCKFLAADNEYDDEIREFYDKSIQKYLYKKFGEKYKQDLKEYYKNNKNQELADDLQN